MLAGSGGVDDHPASTPVAQASRLPPSCQRRRIQFHPPSTPAAPEQRERYTVPCVPCPRYGFWVRCAAPAPSWNRPRNRTATLVRAIDKYRRAIGQSDRIPTRDVFSGPQRPQRTRRRPAFALVSLGVEPPAGIEPATHPYHGTTRNRCAERRNRRSRLTVRVEVIGSLLATVCALLQDMRSAEPALMPSRVVHTGLQDLRGRTEV
jgi:hypothetical protein